MEAAPVIGLTEDERTVLELGTQTHMIPIGRWEKPIKALIARGLMEAINPVNVVTTDAGKQALENSETQVFGELVQAALETAYNEIRKDVESAAHILARIAQRSSRVTGKPAPYECRGWITVLGKRAMEILGG